MPTLEILPNMRFGKLETVAYVNGRWFCKCDCGNEVRVIAGNLRKGNSTSCGCKKRERSTRHGLSNSKEYRVWQEMIQRCENPNNQAYANYGGRGIAVCDRWKDFAVFITDMGRRPKNYQIDRIDNDKGYSPDNCRWVPSRINLSNKRNNHKVEYQDQTLTVAEWSRVLGIHERTLFNRLGRGWPVDRAFTEKPEPKAYKDSREAQYPAFGRSQTLTQWCQEYGIDRERVRGRLRMNWSLEKALLGSKGN